MRRALILAVLAFPATAGAAYDPKVTVSIPTSGGPGSPAAVTATVTQATGDDSHRTIEARLPGTFGFNAGFVQSSAAIGHVSAESVSGAASGELFLTEDYRIVGEIRALGGLVAVPFNGVLEVLPGQEIRLRFDNLPDVAATRLSVQMEGGVHTPLALPRRCGTHVITVRLVGHSGDERLSEHPVAIGGCRASLPTATAVRVSRGVLRWKTRGAVKTEVVLRRLVRGAWREVARRTTTRTTLRVWRRADAAALVAIAADGTRGLTQVVRL